MPDLLIIGGGYAGVWAAMAAAGRARDSKAALNICLLSRDAYLTHRPRLYECRPQDMRTPLVQVLEPIGVRLALGEVMAIDAGQRRVQAQGEDGGAMMYGYDGLILAAGSVPRPAPWELSNARTWNIDSYHGAVELDRHLKDLLAAPEPAGHEDTVVIIGAGFTGIELAAEMRARLAEHGGVARADRARVILIDAAARVSEDLGPGPRPHILAALQTARVELRLSEKVRRIEGDQVFLDDGSQISAATVIVTTGVQANELAASLGLETDPSGRLLVDANLRVKGVQGIHAAGDMAHALTDASHVALMSCQHAMPMGKFAGYNAASELLNLPPLPYQQPIYRTCLDLGQWGAVFSTGWDRQVEMVKEAAKARKRFINTEVIYPPTNDREAILAAGTIQSA
ncbi:MAG: FAD-dependent oxidoreductase [Proteobacteria bacterium]|nr:FAD-dependent oxidoreductase [Pseudomonadota bacterium]